MKGFFVFVGFIILLAFSAWFLLSYVLISDEQKILRVIEKGRCGVESGSALSIASLLALDYRHENGMSRGEMVGVLQELFQQTKNLRVRVLHSSVRVEGNRAEAQVVFIFSGQTSHSHPVFENMLSNPDEDNQEAQIELIREGRSWLIQKTSLQRTSSLTAADLSF
jgi:hypothetical protein